MKDHLKQQSLCTHKWIKDKYVPENTSWEAAHSVMGLIWTTLAAAFLEDTCGERDSCWAQSENFVKAMIQRWNYRLPSSVALVKDSPAGLQGTVEYALKFMFEVWSETHQHCANFLKEVLNVRDHRNGGQLSQLSPDFSWVNTMKKDGERLK